MLCLSVALLRPNHSLLLYRSDSRDLLQATCSMLVNSLSINGHRDYSICAYRFTTLDPTDPFALIRSPCIRFQLTPHHPLGAMSVSGLTLMSHRTNESMGRGSQLTAGGKNVAAAAAAERGDETGG